MLSYVTMMINMHNVYLNIGNLYKPKYLYGSYYFCIYYVCFNCRSGISEKFSEYHANFGIHGTILGFFEIFECCFVKKSIFFEETSESYIKYFVEQDGMLEINNFVNNGM